MEGATGRVGKRPEDGFRHAVTRRGRSSESFSRRLSVSIARRQPVGISPGTECPSSFGRSRWPSVQMCARIDRFAR